MQQKHARVKNGAVARLMCVGRGACPLPKPYRGSRTTGHDRPEKRHSRSRRRRKAGSRQSSGYETTRTTCHISRTNEIARCCALAPVSWSSAWLWSVCDVSS